jgi:hypothetical protein
MGQSGVRNNDPMSLDEDEVAPKGNGSEALEAEPRSTWNWKEHAPLLISAFSVAFIAIRLVSISNGETETAYGILQASGTATVVTSPDGTLGSRASSPSRSRSPSRSTRAGAKDMLHCHAHKTVKLLLTRDIRVPRPSPRTSRQPTLGGTRNPRRPSYEGPGVSWVFEVNRDGVTVRCL